MKTVLNTRKLDAMIARNPEKADTIVRRFSIKVLQNSRKYIHDKHIIDTGALLNSMAAGPKPGEGPLHYWVHDGVEYGIYNEMGTSRMAARPFLYPAVEDERQNWREAWRELGK